MPKLSSTVRVAATVVCAGAATLGSVVPAHAVSFPYSAVAAEARITPNPVTVSLTTGRYAEPMVRLDVYREGTQASSGPITSCFGYGPSFGWSCRTRVWNVGVYQISLRELTGARLSPLYALYPPTLANEFPSIESNGRPKTRSNMLPVRVRLRA